MKVTKHCYMVPGLGYLPPWTVNSGFIVGEKITLVVDSGPNAWVAETIYGYAHGIQENNSLVLINLEKHMDHVGGNSLFT